MRVSTLGSLLVVQYVAATTLKDLDGIDGVQRALAQRYGRVSVLSIIGELGNIVRVDEPVRKRSNELLTRYERITRGGAIVITTRGLAGVMVRTFMSSLFLLNRTELRMKTFARLDEALQWLQQLPGQDAEVVSLAPSTIEAWLVK